MTITVELGAEDEKRLVIAAAKQGVGPDELVRRLVTDQLKSDLADDRPQYQPKESRNRPSERDEATLTLLELWRREGENATPEEIEEAEQEWEEFTKAINETRRQAGMRTLYP